MVLKFKSYSIPCCYLLGGGLKLGIFFCFVLKFRFYTVFGTEDCVFLAFSCIPTDVFLFTKYLEAINILFC